MVYTIDSPHGHMENQYGKVSMIKTDPKMLYFGSQEISPTQLNYSRIPAVVHGLLCQQILGTVQGTVFDFLRTKILQNQKKGCPSVGIFSYCPSTNGLLLALKLFNISIVILTPRLRQFVRP